MMNFFQRIKERSELHRISKLHDQALFAKKRLEGLLKRAVDNDDRAEIYNEIQRLNQIIGKCMNDAGEHNLKQLKHDINDALTESRQIHFTLDVK